MLSLVSEMLMPLLLFLTVVVVWQPLCYGLCCVCVCCTMFGLGLVLWVFGFFGVCVWV